MNSCTHCILINPLPPPTFSFPTYSSLNNPIFQDGTHHVLRAASCLISENNVGVMPLHFTPPRNNAGLRGPFSACTMR